MTSSKNGLKGFLPYLLAAFIGLMVFSAYSNTFTSPPYLDDFHSFIQEKTLYLEEVSLSSLWSLHESKFGLTRFLPVVTLALNHSLGRSDLIYFHAVNILIHFLAFFAVFWLLRQILSAEKNRNPEGFPYDISGYFPLCVAAIWALSPVQTSAVTYLVQRMASMQSLFFALSVACYIKGRLLPADNSAKAWLFFALCGIAGLCSMLSKENAVMLPVVLLCTDIWLFDAAWTKKAWGYCRQTGWKVKLIATSVILSSLAYGFLFVLPKLLAGYSKRDFSLIERLLTEGRAVVWYMSLLLWPDLSRLSMEHEFEISRSLFSPVSTIPALILIGVMIFLAIRFRKRFPAITYGIAWFFLNLFVESTILPLEIIFEHRLYLPSMGFYLSAAAIFVLIFRRAAAKMPQIEFAKAACSFLLLAASVLAVLTFTRNADWENPLTIYHDTVTKAPHSPRANASYANVLGDIGQHEESIVYAKKSLELGRPGRETFSLAENALLTALLKLERFDEAIESGEKFLEKKKQMDGDALPHVCLNMAQAYRVKDRPQDSYRMAIRALNYIKMTDNSYFKKEYVCKVLLDLLGAYGSKAIDLDGDGSPDPGDMPDALWLALELKKHGETAFALQALAKMQSFKPGGTKLAGIAEDFQRELARDAAEDRAQQEKWNFSEKYVRNPFSKFNFCMAVAYLVQEKHLPGIFVEAGEKLLDAAIETNPGSADAWLLKGWYLYHADRADEAVAAARRSIECDPANAKPWLGLGFFLAKAGAAREAVAAFERVIEIYPRYSQRASIETLCDQLRRAEEVDPPRPDQNESNMKAGLPVVPST
ncbi:MAG: tetratricopeptide repeat protein [Desulfobacteraceae bacterium]|nr:tetratricopeptide repeat protein [Desulfobacteraceae bacterium]